MVKLHIDAGEDRRFLIGADRDDIPSEFGAVKYEPHDKHQDKNPDESDRYERFTGCGDLENMTEPSAGLSAHRPGNRIVARCKRSDTACNHASAQCCQERRQVHDRNHGSVCQSEQNTYEDRHDHTDHNIRSVVFDHCSADCSVSDQTGTDGEIDTASD